MRSLRSITWLASLALLLGMGCQNDTQSGVSQSTPAPEDTANTVTLSPEQAIAQSTIDSVSAETPEPVLAASDSTAEDVARNTWLQINTPPNQAVYFPSGGMRDFYDQVSSRISYQRVQELADMSVFSQGPHSATELELDSDSTFGHYNPEFVTWLSSFAIPIAEHELLRQQLQASYDSYIRPLARIYFGTHTLISSDSSFRDEQAQEYLAHMERAKTQTINPFHHNFHDYVPASYGWDSYLSSTAIAFWLRRYIDGTYSQFGESLSTLLNSYDNHFYHYMKGMPQRVDPASGPLPYFEFSVDSDSKSISVFIDTSDEIPQSTDSTHSNVFILNEQGAVCTAIPEQFEVVEIDICCTETPPNFLTTRYRLDDSCGNGSPSKPLLPANIDQLTIIDYAEELTNVDRWVSESFTVPSVSLSLQYNNRYSTSDPASYRWTKSENGAIWLEAQGAFFKPEQEEIVLDQCRYERSGNIEALFCESTGEYPTSGTYWSLVYDGGILIYAHGEEKGNDEYGPFRAVTKDLVAMYQAEGRTFLAFRPGFVIYQLETIWIQQYRLPLMYYGECDCVDI